MPTFDGRRPAFNPSVPINNSSIPIGEVRAAYGICYISGGLEWWPMRRGDHYALRVTAPITPGVSTYSAAWYRFKQLIAYGFSGI